MKKLFLIIFFIFIFIHDSFGIDYKKYLIDYEKRCGDVINTFSRSENGWLGRHNLLCALSKIAAKHDMPRVLETIDTLTEKPKGDMFWFYQMSALYLFSKDKIPSAYRQKIRDSFKNYTPNRGDTENHWLMYYVSLYLISQEHPGEEGNKWFNGRSSIENFEDADSYIKEWMRITTTIGQGEFDSPNYSDLYATSLVLLYQFSNDPVMKKKAEIMLNWVLADFFVDYFDAIYSGGNSRVYQRNVLSKRDDLMCRLGVFLLGDRPLYDPAGNSDYYYTNQIVFALSDYRIPEYIVNIAFQRNYPYENREMKRSRNRVRYGEEKNPKVSKYGYVTDEYAMGCIRYGQTEQILQHSWNLNWKIDKPGEITTLFSIQPYYSDYDMSSLFNESRKLIVGNIVAGKSDYDKEDKLVGASPAEKLFQYKSTLIGLYDLSSKEIKYKHYDLIIPKSVKEMEKSSSGWIFCKGNNVFIAIYPIKPYNQLEDSVIYRLRSSELINGFIIQVKGSKEIPGYRDFQKQVEGIKLDLSGFDSRHQLSFVDIDGNKMEFSFTGYGKVNGLEDNPLNYKLFDNPFMQSEVGSGSMTISYKNKKFILDCKNSEIIKK